MENKVAVTGNSGPRIRSDCEITLELKTEGGIVIELHSKVKSLYGASIMEQCHTILDFLGVGNAFLSVKDSGALPFVISARIEAAVKQLIPGCPEYLPEMAEGIRTLSSPDRFRFTRLYIPGNTPSMMINAGLHSADGIILDLEDSVAPPKKAEARILVRNALRQIDFRGAERMVRINQGQSGLEDLDWIIPHHVNLILVPKCEDAEQIRIINLKIQDIKDRCRITDPVFIMPIIESALGIERAFDIARASENVVAMAIGLEDFTADLGVPRTDDGKESLYARCRLVNAAKAAGIQPIDSVFSDVDDEDALKKSVTLSKSLGFEGMGCIHPRQIAIIQKGFEPNPEEIEKAVKIVSAFAEAEKNGAGVVALGSKMIDPPVVKRARKTLTLAAKLGIISASLMDNEIVLPG
ncbi:MAG: aldolase/citrate lyase family protein [Bacteroidales bacterium]|jgi:citrate lyase subunit beta/citryl-CoA lyase|nr:aldolase/citrate lyase family protein [Bacteroidales bacterium]